MLQFAELHTQCIDYHFRRGRYSMGYHYYQARNAKVNRRDPDRSEEHSRENQRESQGRFSLHFKYEKTGYAGRTRKRKMT